MDWTFPPLARFQRVFNWKYLYPLEIKQKLYEYLPERWAPAQKKRRLAALKTRLKRVQYFIDLFSPYTTLDCRYETKRMLALYESLPPEEQRLFNMDVRRIDWYQYYQKTHLPGLRRHELGGGDDDQEPLSAAPAKWGAKSSAGASRKASAPSRTCCAGPAAATPRERPCKSSANPAGRGSATTSCSPAPST